MADDSISLQRQQKEIEILKTTEQFSKKFKNVVSNLQEVNTPLAMTIADLRETTSFVYKAPFDNGSTEHELDHVMIGNYNEEPIINKDEVASWKWMPLEDVKVDIALRPEKYTAWFKIIFEKFYEHINVNPS